mgnify:CR=1 FL=1
MNKAQEEHWEKWRESRRALGKRLAFDCMELKEKGNRAICSKGYSLGRADDRSVPLVFILRGNTPEVCKECPSYNG